MVDDTVHQSGAYFIQNIGSCTASWTTSVFIFLCLRLLLPSCLQSTQNGFTRAFSKGSKSSTNVEISMSCSGVPTQGSGPSARNTGDTTGTEAGGKSLTSSLAANFWSCCISVLKACLLAFVLISAAADAIKPSQRSSDSPILLGQAVGEGLCAGSILGQIVLLHFLEGFKCSTTDLS